LERIVFLWFFQKIRLNLQKSVSSVLQSRYVRTWSQLGFFRKLFESVEKVSLLKLAAKVKKAFKVAGVQSTGLFRKIF